MKRLLFIIFLLNVIVLSYADHNWLAIKLGSGTETPGIGFAFEARYTDFGAIGGIGFPNGSVGLSISSKYYLLDSYDQTLFLSLGYGLLNFMILELDTELIETSLVYGPFLMIGISKTWDYILADYSLGTGYSHVSKSLVLTAQASLGFILYTF
jgi:hypothetical protein